MIYYILFRDLLVLDFIFYVLIWLLGLDKGVVISYMMVLLQKMLDVLFFEYFYVIFVYMFIGFLVNNCFMVCGICSNVMVYDFCLMLVWGVEF